MEEALAKALHDVAACVSALRQSLCVLQATKDRCADLPDLERYLEPLEQEIWLLREMPLIYQIERVQARQQAARPAVTLTWREFGQPAQPGQWYVPGVGEIPFVSVRHIDTAAQLGPECNVTLLAFDTESSGSEQGRTWLIREITAPASETAASEAAASEAAASKTAASETAEYDPGGDRPAE